MPTTASAPIASSASTSCWLRIPPATISWLLGQLAQARGSLDGEALHRSFGVDMSVEKCGDVGIKLRYRIVGSQRHLRLPSLHGDAAILRVDAGYDVLAPMLSASFDANVCIDRAFRRKKRRADDDSLRSSVQDLPCALDGVNAAAGLHRQPLRDLLHQRGIVALAHRRVEVDQLDQRKLRELLDPIFKIVEGQPQLFALHKLHNAPAHQINRRNQHGSLTGTPPSPVLL